MSKVPSDVVQFIARRFPVSAQPAARSALDSATLHDGSEPSARMLRCAIVGSQGDLKRLASLLDLLRIDWRDVVVAGEYEREDGELRRVRDLNNAIGGDA